MHRFTFALVAATAACALYAEPVRAQERKASMAVADFTYTARAGVAVTTRTKGRATTVVVPDLGYEFETSALTQKFVTALVKTGKFDIVERSKLEHAMNEQQMSQSGLVDPNRAVQMGKLVGADYFLEGVINFFQANTEWKENPYIKGHYNRIASLRIGVEIRIVDTRTSKITAAERGEVNKTEKKQVQSRERVPLDAATVDGIQRELVDQLVLKVIDGVYPIKVINVDAQNTVYLNRGEGGGVAVGDAFDVFSQGEEMIDPDTGASLGRTESKIGAIRVSSVEPKFSKALILGGRAEKGAICRKGTGTFDGPPPPPPPPPAEPPVVTILAPRSNQMLNSNPINVVVEVTTKNSTITRVTIAGAPAQQDPSNPSRWKGKVKASEGGNRVVVKAWNDQQQEGSAQVIFQFKERPPEVQGRAIITYHGKVDDPKATVTVNGQRVTVNPDGTFECQVRPDENGNVTIIATDEFGNEQRKVERIGG